MKSLLSFLAGAAVGAAIGVLFAPEKGEDTRAQLKTLLQKRGIIKTDDELDAIIAEIEREAIETTDV